MDYPTNISWERDGNDLVVQWTPPKGVEEGMWYKVFVSSQDDPGKNQKFDWNVQEARMKNLSFQEGEELNISVSLYFVGGSGDSGTVSMVW